MTATVTTRPIETSASSLAPRTFLAWSAGALAVSILADNPIYRGLLIAAALAVLQTWLPRGRSLRTLGVAAAFAAVFAIVLNVALAHTGDHVLWQLPGEWPVVGGPATLEALAWGGAVALGLIAALLAAAPLSFILEPHEIVDALPGPFQRTGIAVAASLNLVSGIGRSFREVRDAQLMRGWKPRGIRSWNEVLVPVVLTAIEDSVLLAESMEARGFGRSRRSSYAESRFGHADVLVLLAVVVGVGTFLVAPFLGIATQWYPYPALNVPAADPALVVAVLAFAVPALIGPGDRPLDREPSRPMARAIDRGEGR